MKKLLLLIAAGFIQLSAFAQTPQAINYQAALRNSSGTVMASTAVQLRFSIRDVNATGTVIFLILLQLQHKAW
jgi:hypothetical protein